MFIKPVFGADDQDRHVLVVQTCDRPYFGRTLESLKSAGVDRWRGPKIVYGDGYDPSKRWNLRYWDGVCFSEKAQGNTRGFLRALLYARDFEPSRATFIEDDVVFACNALDYVANVKLKPDLFLASWFTLRSQPGPDRGWYTRSMSSFARNQALTLPRSTLDRVTDDDRVMGWPHRSGIDRCFGLFWPDEVCTVHFPNLVQHIGGVSAIGFQGEQISPTFVGESFDARSWIQ